MLERKSVQSVQIFYQTSYNAVWAKFAAMVFYVLQSMEVGLRMDVHRIPRLIRERGAAGSGRSFGARRHVDKKPVSTELTPILGPPSYPPVRSSVPRRRVRSSVAAG